MIGFKFKNVNPKGRKTTDCVIRAIAEASAVPYEQVLKDLVEIQLKTGYDMSSKQGYERLLKQYGWIKHKQPRKLDGSKYRVREINKLVHPHERAIISITHHLTAKVESDIIDIWDCRSKTIGNYFTHPDDIL